MTSTHFIKENYARIKAANDNLSHQTILEHVRREYAARKKQTASGSSSSSVL